LQSSGVGCEAHASPPARPLSLLNDMRTSTRTHYAALFADVEREFGPTLAETLTGIVGFSAGGPVSMCRLGTGGAYVTCELSLSSGQKISKQGLRFELLSRLPLSEADTQDLLTSIGSLSLEATLGDRHTVDVSAISPSPDIKKIRLMLYSSCDIGEDQFGIYEVRNADAM
jgi:hypothetical protein